MKLFLSNFLASVTACFIALEASEASMLQSTFWEGPKIWKVQSTGQREKLEQEIRLNDEKLRKSQSGVAKAVQIEITNFENIVLSLSNSLRKSGCNGDEHKQLANAITPLLASVEHSIKVARLQLELERLGQPDNVALKETMLQANKTISSITLGQLHFADAALRKKCLDTADGIYRRVATQPGNADLIRRANIGIDDVRAARYASK